MLRYTYINVLGLGLAGCRNFVFWLKCGIFYCTEPQNSSAQSFNADDSTLSVFKLSFLTGHIVSGGNSVAGTA